MTPLKPMSSTVFRLHDLRGQQFGACGYKPLDARQIVRSPGSVASFASCWIVAGGATDMLCIVMDGHKRRLLIKEYR